MAMTRRDFDAMASIISSTMADVATPLGFVRSEEGVRAVTQIAIAYMNQAWESNRNFNGRKFIEAAGLTPWVEWHEGMTHKNAQWTRAMRDHVKAYDEGDHGCRRLECTGTHA